MPKINMKKKIYKKRPVKKSGTFKTNEPKNNVMMGTGLATRLACKLKYTDTIIMTSTAGAITDYQFRLNSLFDPDFTGTGHQPMYFDQYAALYNHYTVIGAKLTARFVSYESNTCPIIVCAFRNDDTTIINSSSIEYCAEQTGGKTYLLGDGGDSSKTLVIKYAPKKMFGALLPNVSQTTAVNANPSEQTIASLMMQSADVISSTNAAVQINIEFIVVFSELRDIVGS